MSDEPLYNHPLVKRAREYGDYEGPLVPAEPTTIQVGSQPEIQLYGNVPEHTQPVPVPPGMGYYGSPEETPGYEKLTRAERWLYDRLPGIAESSIGQALAKFNESWAGKLLQKVDIPAEGLERGVGLFSQWLASIGNKELTQDFTDNFEAAWFAGSLAADEWFHHMPRIENGRMQWPTDTPGNPVGADQLRLFRNDIADLMKQGMDGGEALTQVRDEYYNSLGALAIRSQMGDAVFHILADPLNIVMGFLHPVELVAKIRNKLRLKVLAQHVGEAQDAARVAQETMRTAEEAFRVSGAFSDEALRAATQAVEEAELGVSAAEKALANAQIEARLAALRKLRPEDIIYFDEARGNFLVDVQSAGGTMGARIVEDIDTGARYIAKTYRNANQTAGEALANSIYKWLGVNVPESELTMQGGKLVHLSEELPGQLLNKAEDMSEFFPQLQKNFVADAYLGNWDVLGLGKDNIIIVEGVPYRVDQGGSFFFRAQGGLKDFNAGEVKELQSMAAKQADVFGNIPEEVLKARAADIAEKMSDDFIDYAVDAARFEDPKMAESIKEALKARRDWLAEYSDLPENLIGSKALPQTGGEQAANRLLSQAETKMKGARELFEQKVGEKLSALTEPMSPEQEARMIEAATNLADARKNAKEMQEFAEFAATHKMNWAEEKLWHILKADPLYVPKNNLWMRINPFALTRSSRAHELMNTILEHINTRVFSISGTGPDEWVRAVQRARAGFYTRQFGHSIITAEGRAVKATLDVAAESMEAALKQYNRLEMFEGPVLRRIGDILETHPSEILRRLADGEEAALATQITERIAKLGDEARDLPLLLRSANMSMEDLPEALNRLRIYEGFEIYTPELFQLELSNRLVDRVSELAIARFGIRQQGAVHRYADAIKAAESLAFLKANPAYPIRNAINNFFTSVGRGVYGNPLKSYDDLFKTLGIPEPARFRTGVGWGGMVEDIDASETIAKAYAQGSRAIREIERPMKGTLGKVTRWLQERRGLGFGKLSQDIEAKASVRAYGATFSKYMSEGHQMGKTLTHVADFDPQLAAMLGPERVKILEQAIQSNWSEPLIRKAIFEDNAHINITSILDDARGRTNLPINDILGPDFTQQVGTRLAEVARTGGEGAVHREMSRIRNLVQQHIEDHVDNVVNTMLEETAARVGAEGPGSFPSLLSETMDDLMVAQHKHGYEMAQIGDIIRDTSGASRGRFWDSLFADNRNFFRRNWQRMEARVKGVQKGIANSIDELRSAGKLTPELEGSLTRFSDEFTESFTSWRNGWDEFYDLRTRRYAELRGMKPGLKREKAWANIEAELDREFTKAFNAEDAITHDMDVSVSKLLPDETAEAFMKGRNRIAAHRKGMRESVLGFRRQVRHMPAEIRENAWKKFWGEYMDQSKQMAMEERTFMAAMQGDPVAMERMGMVPEEIKVVMEVKKDLLAGRANMLNDKYKTAFAKMRENIVETDELRRLRGKFGEYDPTTAGTIIQDELGDWRKINPDEGATVARFGIASQPGEAITDPVLGKVYLPTMEELAQDLSLESVVDAWVVHDNKWKKVLVDYVKANPEAAKHTQDVAQWILREMGFDDLQLYSGKMPEMFVSTSGRTLEDISLRPFDSLTADQRVAEIFAKAEGHEFVLGFEVPVDNIFTHHMGSPSFTGHPTEYEFILNDMGFDGVKIKTINGQPVSPEQMAILKERFPGLRFDEAKEFPALASFHDVVGRQLVDGKVVDELWYLRGNRALDAIEESAVNMVNKPKFNFDVPEGAENMLRSYMDKITNETSDNLYRATRMGEWGRDSALLNYNRRFNYNTWLGTIAPYEFWATQTAWKWALHSIDRPAMLTTYLRMKKLMNTAGSRRAGFPSRLRQHFSIKLPFLPKWMGDDVFVDPLSTALPFDNFARPFERMKQQGESDTFKAEQVLEELLNDAKITQEQYDQAVSGHEGPVWERAIALGRQDDTENRESGFDFMSMLVSPHAPILWAYNVARGTPENIQPALPITRSIKGITALLGVGPNGEGINIEGKVRQMMGLPAFDKWDDYRIDRMLSNMAATKEISVDEAMRAMIEREGDIYMLARRRAAIEYGVGAMGSTTGIPSKAYPLGEEKLREMKPLYEDAWRRYEAGDQKAMQNFYDQYPEYETRLALWKKPDERMRSFLIDELWSNYHDLPNIQKWELKEQLGPLYEKAFINKDTRNYDAIPLETMQFWLTSMGGKPVGSMQYDAEKAFTPVELTDTATARQVQVFYDLRERMFQYQDAVRPLQNDYFKLAEGAARRNFRQAHPELERYWNWRREFMLKNPSIMRYIEDDPGKQPKYQSEAQMQQYQQQEQTQGGKTRSEWRTTLGYSAWNLVEQHLTQGTELPPVVLEYLQLATGQDPQLVLAQVDQVLAGQ